MWRLLFVSSFLFPVLTLTAPGVPCQAANKTILGTSVKVGDTFNGNFDQILCQFDYTKDGVQQWHDSVVALWASWGVDMIKVSRGAIMASLYESLS